MDILHVWIGCAASAEEFARYFAINPADLHTQAGASQFDKDLGTQWYDDDLIGVYYNAETDDLATALEELPAVPATLAAVRAKCREAGIVKANALFYYNDADLIVADTARKYNGLTYLGAFDNA